MERRPEHLISPNIEQAQFEDMVMARMEDTGEDTEALVELMYMNMKKVLLSWIL